VAFNLLIKETEQITNIYRFMKTIILVLIFVTDLSLGGWAQGTVATPAAPANRAQPANRANRANRANPANAANPVNRANPANPANTASPANSANPANPANPANGFNDNNTTYIYVDGPNADPKGGNNNEGTGLAPAPGILNNPSGIAPLARNSTPIGPQVRPFPLKTPRTATNSLATATHHRPINPNTLPTVPNGPPNTLKPRPTVPNQTPITADNTSVGMGATPPTGP
jgi:hypothetical protein